MNVDEFPTERFRMIEPPRPCSYVKTETAALEYRVFPSLTPKQVEQLYLRGWRRFGPYCFRPACRNCSKCVPIRVVVENFRPSKSQRKAQRRNRHISIQLTTPTVTNEHVELYNRWHRAMTDDKGWPVQQTSAEEYADGFLSGDYPSLQEVQYFDGATLVGVGLIDLLPNSISSAYFYHDPQWRPLGPGTFSILTEIQLARDLQRSHLYLGYWIAECPSMSYKNRFHPYETLVGVPDDDESPTWSAMPPSH